MPQVVEDPEFPTEQTPLPPPDYSITISNSRRNRSDDSTSRTNMLVKPSYLYIALKYPKFEHWVNRTEPATIEEASSHILHCGTVADGASYTDTRLYDLAIQNIQETTYKMKFGLQLKLDEFREDLRGDLFTIEKAESEASIKERFDSYCDELIKVLTPTTFFGGGSRSLIISRVSQSTINEITKIMKLVEDENINGCFIYSDSLNKDPTWTNSLKSWLHSSNTSEPIKMREYIEYSKGNDVSETQKSLKMLADILRKRVNSKTDRPSQLLGHLMAWAKYTDVSVHCVKQEVMDELISCDPVMMTDGTKTRIFDKELSTE